MKWNIENILINIKATLKEMKETFAAGVNTIYEAIVARDVTPASKSPADMAAAIAEISGSELIPVVVNGVLIEGFEFQTAGGGVVTYEDGYIDITTHVGTAYFNTTLGAVFVDCEVVNAQYSTVRISDSTGYSTAQSGAYGVAGIQTIGNYKLVAGLLNNATTNVVFNGGANGHYKVKNVYIYRWEDENNG